MVGYVCQLVDASRPRVAQLPRRRPQADSGAPPRQGRTTGRDGNLSDHRSPSTVFEKHSAAPSQNVRIVDRRRPERGQPTTGRIEPVLQTGSTQPAPGDVNITSSETGRDLGCHEVDDGRKRVQATIARHAGRADVDDGRDAASVGEQVPREGVEVHEDVVTSGRSAASPSGSIDQNSLVDRERLTAARSTR